MRAHSAIDFRSDNVGTASPEILAAIQAANSSTATSYGEDAISAALNEGFSKLFEASVIVFPVATGTAANALALAACVRPYGGVYCHEQAHILTSEGAATEAFSGGARLIPVPGEGFRLRARGLEQVLPPSANLPRHKPQPNVVSVTQATEYGTVYRLDELAAIATIAQRHGLRVHMDGARIANALARLGCSAAAMTWRSGVDVLSFGATKNGGLNAEAIVVFDSSLIEDLSYRLRRAGQVWSKMRFAAAGLLAYVENGLFLRSAARANALATQLEAGLRGIPAARVIAPVEANLVFVELPESVVSALEAEGFLFFRRSPRLIRLVCRFDGSDEDVDRFLETVDRLTQIHAARRDAPADVHQR
jgi:threonine aldolase